MADVGQTQPLDPIQIIVSQLTELTREMRQVPQLLARLDALTESTQQLQVALREATAELRARDEAQQRAIEDVRLRMSEMLAAFSGLSGTVQELRQDYFKRISSVERQATAAMDAASLQNAKLREIEARQGDSDFRMRLEACANEFAQWRPWLAGLKWGLVIIGGIILTAITGALLWSLVQSGGGLP